MLISKDLQTSLFADNPEYDDFVAKFEPKKTTDDCYTPPLVYDAIRDWACEQYGIDPGSIVRPFYQGGDYEAFDYPDGCVVLDNPPFSILSQICDFYLNRGIRFFLFAPSLTAFSGKSVAMRMNHIVCDADIIYENGACVKTAFVTSYGGDIVAQTAPDLGAKIAEAVKKIKAMTTATKPKYIYPDHIVTAAMLQRYSKYGVNFRVRRGDCVLIAALDDQRRAGKTIFGGGLLLSEKAAAETAAAETWRLSPREKAIIATLGARDGKNKTILKADGRLVRAEDSPLCGTRMDDGACNQVCKYNTPDRGCVAGELGARCDLTNVTGERGNGEAG